jgi:hypothetical protein
MGEGSASGVPGGEGLGKGGLEMSLRHAYFNPAERQAALVLWRALRLAAERLAQGERQGARLAATLRDCLAYVAVCDPDTLREVEQLSGTVLVALAVYIGKTRLIDNAIRSVGDCSLTCPMRDAFLSAHSFVPAAPARSTHRLPSSAR